MLSVPQSSAASSSITLGASGGPSATLGLDPVTPLQSSRYKPVPSFSKVRLPERHPAGLYTGKGRLDSSVLCLHDLPPPWQQFVHPDGKPYFRHPEWKLITEVNVRDARLRNEIQSLYLRINDAREKTPLSDSAKPSENTELYVVLNPNGTNKGSYYYVDHNARQAFWVEDVLLDHIMPVCVPRDSSFELSMLRNYYRHLENFPCHNSLPGDAIRFLRRALTYGCADHMTARESATAPWNAADCKTFLDLMDTFKTGEITKCIAQPHLITIEDDPTTVEDDSTTFDDGGYQTWFVARLICVILHSRSVHRFGMHNALTDRLATVRRSQIGPLDLVAGGLSFWAHHTYMDRLENVWAGGVVSVGGWASLINSLVAEWSDSNLLSTVILSANMSFLTLQQVHDVERTSSIISASLALGSIVVGLHHVWRHRAKKDTSAGQAGIYFRNAMLRTGNLKLLAFFLSLPLILLSWSVLTFACSISLYTFYEPQPRTVYIMTGTMFSTVVIIVLATMMFFWNIFLHNPTSMHR